MRQHHDMGGEPAGRVEKTEHDYAPWEKRVDALLVLLSDRERSLIRTDELRKNIEAIGPDAYEKMSYYERWITSVTANLLQRGAITAEELSRKLADVERREKEGLL